MIDIILIIANCALNVMFLLFVISLYKQNRVLTHQNDMLFEVISILTEGSHEHE